LAHGLSARGCRDGKLDGVEIGCLGRPLGWVVNREAEVDLAIAEDILLGAPKNSPSVLGQFRNSHGNSRSRRRHDIDRSIEGSILVLAVQVGPEKPILNPSLGWEGD
jgi:hypothetical protein